MKCCSFELFITKNLEILSSTTIFNIDKKKFHEYQFSILEGYLKNHVTSKTGGMMLQILRYFKTENI